MATFDESLGERDHAGLQFDALVDRLGVEHELARTRERLTAAESQGAALERNLADTRTVLAVYESTAKSLGDEITALRRDLDESRRGNASPEAVQAYKSTIAELERQLASARNGAALPTAAEKCINNVAKAKSCCGVEATTRGKWIATKIKHLALLWI